MPGDMVRPEEMPVLAGSPHPGSARQILTSPSWLAEARDPPSGGSIAWTAR